MAVGIGQRRPRRRLDPRARQLAFTALQAAADLAQRVRPNWQNIIGTNWLQLLSPFAARSAPVSRTSF
jgi:hypothetical protein